MDPPDSSTNPEKGTFSHRQPLSPRAALSRCSSSESSVSERAVGSPVCGGSERRIKSAVQVNECSGPVKGKQRTKSGPLFGRKYQKAKAGGRQMTVPPPFGMLNWNNRKMLLKLQQQLRLQGLCLSSLSAAGGRSTELAGMLNGATSAGGSIDAVGGTPAGCYCHCACAATLPVGAGENPEPPPPPTHGGHATFHPERRDVCSRPTTGGSVRIARPRQPKANQEDSVQSAAGHVRSSHRHNRHLGDVLSRSSYQRQARHHHRQPQDGGSSSRSSSCDSSEVVSCQVRRKLYHHHHHHQDEAEPNVRTQSGCSNRHQYLEPQHAQLVREHCGSLEPHLHPHHLPHSRHHHPSAPHQKLCIRTTTAAASRSSAAASIPICMHAMHSVVR